MKARASVLRLKDNRSSAIFAHEKNMVERIEKLSTLHATMVAARNAADRSSRYSCLLHE